MADNVLVQVQNLKKYFPITRGLIFSRHVGDVKAVDDVSFDIHRGETLGLVGESGCGKTTAGRTIIQLYRPTAGHIYYEGQDLTQMKGSDMRHMRRKMQIIFQDPYASLNPRLTVGAIVGEPLEIHHVSRGKEMRERVEQLLELVGLNPYFINRYPHEFSGGQRQRIGVARALALDPEFIVCDEPISALDVSIQAQIVNLLEELQGRLGLTYLFIAHDLSMVRHISDRVAVMYLGRLVETGEGDRLFAEPLHPYTRALLSAVPKTDAVGGGKRIVLKGDVPSPVSPPSGCHFHPRCAQAMDRCRREAPELRDTGGGYKVACWLHVA